MAYQIDHDRKRAVFTAEPGFSGTVLSRAIAEALDADPRLAGYDFILDVRDSDTGAQPSDIQIVVEAYRRHAGAPGVKYGCFVSTDPNYPLWTATLDHLLGDRQNKVFVTPERARIFLDRMRG